MILLARARPAVSAASFEHLRHADLWALLLELVVFVIFLISLGGLLLPVMHTAHGKLLVIGTLVLGLLLPLVLLLARKVVLHFHAAGIADQLQSGPNQSLARAVAFLYRAAFAAIVMTDFNRRDPEAVGA